MKKKVLTIVGARPNFIKITQFHKVFSKFSKEFEHRLLHTGQHFDQNMSSVFFDQLQIPKPDYHLNIKGKSVVDQIATIMIELEKVVDDYAPDLLIVVGDVNSTLACSLVANKKGIKLAHVESGLRSRDRGMPEEINRLLTDEIADFLFVTEPSGIENLLAEGKAKDKIHFVGNTMIDTLVAFEDDIQKSKILQELEINNEDYALVTMHRPATVDVKENLILMLELLEVTSHKLKIVFPIHPRTAQRIEKFGLKEKLDNNKNIIQAPPAGYLDFQKLIASAKFVLTDSGGIQEETTFRKIPCLTLRPNTERPVTITQGSNELVTFDKSNLIIFINQILDGTYKVDRKIPELWDGSATERIVEVFRREI